MGIKTFCIGILRHKALCGGLIFLCILFMSCYLLSRTGTKHFLEVYFTTGIASLAAWLLKLIGMNVSSTGSSIIGHGFSVDIKYGCNAIYEIMIFTAAVAAYRSHINERGHKK